MKSLSSISIPETVASIGENAFKDCGNLTGEITLGEDCATIGNNAFSGTKISKITIKNASCEIGDGAIPANTEIYGVKGSTAEAYAPEGMFHEIETTENIITISKNEKDYLPTTIVGTDVAWDEVSNQNIEVEKVVQGAEGNQTAYYVIVGLSEGTTTITGTLKNINDKITVTMTVGAYDEDAMFHFVKGSEVTVASNGSENYTLSFPATLNVDYSKLRINGVYGQMTASAEGNIYSFNSTDLGSADGLVDIQIVYEVETDTQNVSSKLYHLGESIKTDAQPDRYGLGFVTRSTSIIRDADYIGGKAGKFRSDFVVDGVAATPVKIGALVAPEALTTDENGFVDTSKLALTQEQINDLAGGNKVNVAIKTVNSVTYYAQNVVIDKITDVTDKYADFRVVLSGIPEDMAGYEMVYRSYVIYQKTDSSYAVKYEDVTTRSYNDALACRQSVSAGTVFTAKVPSAFANSENAVICWGDSITQSTVGNSYPSKLQQNLAGQYKVYNAGVAGETGIAIMSRNNIVDIGNGQTGAGLLMNDVTFEAGVAKSADIAIGDSTTDMPRGRAVFKDNNGTLIRYVGFGNEMPTVDLIINGQSGYKLSYDNVPDSVWGKYSYHITRANTGEPLTLPAGSTVKFDYNGIDANSRAQVVLFGANDGEASNSSEIIDKDKKFESKNEKSLFIIPYFFQIDKTGDYVNNFGNKAVNVAEYFSQKAFDDYGIFPDYIDLEKVEKHQMPYEFIVKDDAAYGVANCHLNALGYEILADVVYAKGQELGYWN